MSAPLTVLHLTHEGHGAGSSISIALLARAQQRQGWQVSVGCPPGTWLAQLVKQHGIPFAPLAFTSTRAAADQIERLSVLGRVDVVNAHSSRDRAATRRLRLGGRLRPALVMTRRGMPMSTPFSAVLSGFAADRVIAVSRPVARSLALRGTPPWRIRVVPNAVDLERVDRVVTAAEREAALEQLGDRGIGGLGDGAGKPVIGVVSRRKDHGILLEAMRHVTTPATLCSIGFAQSTLLSPNPPIPLSPHRVVFLPFQDDPRPFYDLFDVVVLPTRHEGLSQGLMEAMALGQAIVTTRSGGNTDLIEHGVHGLLVPPLDAPALGAAIQRLLDDPALRRRLGAEARLRVRSEFTIERTVAATEAVYREALAR